MDAPGVKRLARARSVQFVPVDFFEKTYNSLNVKIFLRFNEQTDAICGLGTGRSRPFRSGRHQCCVPAIGKRIIAP